MKKLVFLVCIALHIGDVNGQSLTIPIDGTAGQDYIIVNYPDWHLQDGPVHVQDGFLKDHKCGTKTYDGHQGTDFTIRGFTQMDSGVNVLASADGLITYVIDSLFDRETGGIIALSLGNYVEIYHAATSTYSYYAHLKKNSVTMQVGDLVSAGQTIAQVGSSGNSTDPHLHYELWNQGLITDPTIDPWGSPCNSGATMWQNSPNYDTTYALWESGLVNYDSVENFVPTTWNPLRERIGQKDTFTVSDPFFTFWALQYGLKIGDQTTIEWYEPNGNLYYAETTDYLSQDWWFHYFNNSIVTPPESKHGLWTIKYFYNSQLQQSKTFVYQAPAGVEEQPFKQPYYFNNSSGNVEIVLPKGQIFDNLTLYSITGELVKTEKLNDGQNIQLILPKNYANGLYIVSLKNSNSNWAFKVVFE